MDSKDGAGGLAPTFRGGVWLLFPGFLGIGE